MKMLNKKKYKYLALVRCNPFLLTDTRASMHWSEGLGQLAQNQFMVFGLQQIHVKFLLNPL